MLLIKLIQYLLCKGVGWSSVSVALAVDSGLCTSTNGIHLPVSVVVVHHMEISMSTPALFIVHVLWAPYNKLVLHFCYHQGKIAFQYWICRQYGYSFLQPSFMSRNHSHWNGQMRHGNQEAFNMPVLIEKLPWHSLDKSLSKVVVGNSHLHLLVPGIRITVAQQHNLIQLHTYKCHYHSKNTDGSKY